MSSGIGVFLREFYTNFHTTGAIAPSSRWVARALTRDVGRSTSPQRILEVGPGTGAITATLVERLGVNDRLTLVELNPRFVEHLKHRFAREPSFLRVADRVEIITDRVEHLPADPPYDLVISGLPLNNFAVADVEQILTQLERLVAPEGTLSFFEYAVLRAVKRRVLRGAERERLTGIDTLMKRFFRRHEHHRQWVLRNFPPAWVHHVRRPPGSTSERGSLAGSAS